MDIAELEQPVFVGFAPAVRPFRGEEWPDAGRTVADDVLNSALGDDFSAFRAGIGTEFDEPVGLLQDLRVVIDEQHGVAVGHEVVHHAVESHDVGGVQSDGGLVEDVEHAGGSVADGAGELHTLSFACG